MRSDTSNFLRMLSLLLSLTFPLLNPTLPISIYLYLTHHSNISLPFQTTLLFPLLFLSLLSSSFFLLSPLFPLSPLSHLSLSLSLLLSCFYCLLSSLSSCCYIPISSFVSPLLCILSLWSLFPASYFSLLMSLSSSSGTVSSHSPHTHISSPCSLFPVSYFSSLSAPLFPLCALLCPSPLLPSSHSLSIVFPRFAPLLSPLLLSSRLSSTDAGLARYVVLVTLSNIHDFSF